MTGLYTDNYRDADGEFWDKYDGFYSKIDQRRLKLLKS